jgi:hypothetical protein
MTLSDRELAELAQRAAQEELEAVSTQLLIEIAFLVPKGTDMRVHPIGRLLTRFKKAVEDRVRADTLDARPQTWQPIDSHDGSSANVLVGHDGSHGSPRWVCEARWDADQRGWWEANTHHTDHCDRQVFPTHFCELPDPPVSDRRLPDASTPRPDEPRDLNIGEWPKPKGESGDQRGRRLDPGRGRFRG